MLAALLRGPSISVPLLIPLQLCNILIFNFTFRAISAGFITLLLLLRIACNCTQILPQIFLRSFYLPNPLQPAEPLQYQCVHQLQGFEPLGSSDQILGATLQTSTFADRFSAWGREELKSVSKYNLFEVLSTEAAGCSCL